LSKRRADLCAAAKFGSGCPDVHAYADIFRKMVPDQARVAKRGVRICVLLTGSIPISIGASTSLRQVNIGVNNFSGSLPYFSGKSFNQHTTHHISILALKKGYASFEATVRGMTRDEHSVCKSLLKH